MNGEGTLLMTEDRLAADGGKPVRNVPFPRWPRYEEDEISAVTEVLRSGKVNYWTGGECVRFEQEYATRLGRRYALSLANGTVALELALRAFGIGRGDEVITSARTFIASASSAVQAGATPVLADVDPISQNITAESIQAVMTARTKAIIPVHLAGWPCDMDSIMELARAHGIRVIEDCAQAHGAMWNGKPVGSFGDAAAFSFCQDKIISTGGEGGLLALDDEQAWRRAWAYKDHGKNYDLACLESGAATFRWIHESFGTNWRMTEPQAAIGLIQLGKLDQWVSQRRANARMLEDGLKTIPALRVTPPPANIFHSYYRYYVFVRPGLLTAGWDRDRITHAIACEGIPCGSGACPELYKERAFTQSGFGPVERLPAAKELGETSIAFLVHPTLGNTDMADMCAAARKVLSRAAK